MTKKFDYKNVWKMKKTEVVSSLIEYRTFEFLKQNSDSNYRIFGIMSECFGIPPKEIEINFRRWKSQENVRLYYKLNILLSRLVREKKLVRKKIGKAFFYGYKKDQH